MFHCADPESKEIIGLIKAVLSVATDDRYRSLLYIETVSRLWRCLCGRISADTAPVLSPIQQQRIADVRFMLSYIHANYGKSLTVEKLAQQANIGRTECFRLFKENVGKSPIEYILSYRLTQAARLLAESQQSVSQIYESCGFHSGSYFSSKFRQAYGVSPREYRRQYMASN